MAKNDREFLVESPLGTIKAKASHDVDLSIDYPGVHVFLVKDDGEETLLTVVEYESTKDYIQSVVYGHALQEEPTDIVVHTLIPTVGVTID